MQVSNASLQILCHYSHNLLEYEVRAVVNICFALCLQPNPDLGFSVQMFTTVSVRLIWTTHLLCADSIPCATDTTPSFKSLWVSPQGCQSQTTKIQNLSGTSVKLLQRSTALSKTLVTYSEDNPFFSLPQRKFSSLAATFKEFEMGFTCAKIGTNLMQNFPLLLTSRTFSYIYGKNKEEHHYLTLD